MTYRAVRVLGEVTCIAAEDTRHTRKLLAHYEIHTELISYHEHNKDERGSLLIARLLQGENIACVSDAGYPAISDPGEDLAKRAIAAGIPVTVLPGANAALPALIGSGLNATRFSFIGFLPRTAHHRQELLAEIKDRRDTLLFYEAPHRLFATLQELQQALGNRKAVLARELTKRFEEYLRHDLAGLCQYYETHTPRGEFVIVVAGCDAETMIKTKTQDVSPLAMAQRLLDEGCSPKEASRQAAQTFHLSRREVYQALLTRKQDGD